MAEEENKSEIKDRLSAAGELCIKSYEAWIKDKKNTEARGVLMEAMHELRKATARLEIEVAVSERDEITSKPIPIPQHRSSRKQHPMQDHGGNDGNRSGGPKKPQGRSGGRRKAASSAGNKPAE